MTVEEHPLRQPTTEEQREFRLVMYRLGYRQSHRGRPRWQQHVLRVLGGRR